MSEEQDAIELRARIRELEQERDRLLFALKEAVAIFNGEFGSDWADDYGAFWEMQKFALEVNK